MALLYEVEFSSFLVYSPHGIEKVSKTSKAICLAIKNDGLINPPEGAQRAIPYFVRRLSERVQGTPLAELFANRPVLVPAPRSSLMVSGGLHPTKLICDQMVAHGLGSESRLLVERITAVKKAAAAATPAERPTVQQHFDSLRVTADLVAPPEIVIVDDVVTRGTMFLAAASRLKEAYPNSNVRAFALVRTMSGQEVDNYVNICRGAIFRKDVWGTRRP